MRDIAVTKVKQDDAWSEIFKDSTEAYYATTKVPGEHFLFNWTTTLEQLNFDTRLVDKKGNNFRMLEWSEV